MDGGIPNYTGLTDISGVSRLQTYYIHHHPDGRRYHRVPDCIYFPCFCLSGCLQVCAKHPATFLSRLSLTFRIRKSCIIFGRSCTNYM